MKTMTVGEVKTHFSEVLKEVEAGERIAITFGKKKEIKAFLIPKEEELQPRTLGILRGKGKVVFKDNYQMTEEEFLEV
ncbi:prevent-host-death protein [Siphonobacter sp. BAB-5385]|uniref:Prevent-host-death protein n=1 Tax=Siphonobacter curvatus TaxID=2094562 RepID=A0A2S7ITU3_9BACT|nr:MULTISPECIES: prevent-host-death protein [Siphonobacter]OZI05314.1 prevent-host-death protein [Siphonobacter sp. BAB-5385]PMD99583.1 prevent-host-death protein [Siphonobacter sp. BAB-5405]PQA61121.1 prevent-host-death protein [Siphonobacter curvatus]